VTVQLAGALVSDEALASIVRGAVSQVAGVRLDRPGRVTRALPGRRDAVSWDIDDRGARFDLDIAASYGVPLPQAASEVRDHVAAAVLAMTGLAVRSVDVTVTGVER